MYEFNRAREFDFTYLNNAQFARNFYQTSARSSKTTKKKKKKEERDKQAIKRHVEDRYCGDAISHSSSNKIVYTTLDINRRIYA